MTNPSKSLLAQRIVVEVLVDQLADYRDIETTSMSSDHYVLDIQAYWQEVRGGRASVAYFRKVTPPVVKARRPANKRPTST